MMYLYLLRDFQVLAAEMLKKNWSKEGERQKNIVQQIKQHAASMISEKKLPD